METEPPTWSGWLKLSDDLDRVVQEIQQLRDIIKRDGAPAERAAHLQGYLDAALQVLAAARSTASLTGIEQGEAWKRR